MAGTLTITSPATDNAAGFSTTTIPIAWSFAGTAGATQVQYRVVLTRVGDTLSTTDTGLISSTSVTSYSVGPLASGIYYSVAVSVVDSDGATTTTTRGIVSKYARALPPVVTLDQDVNGNVVVGITNPTDGARPVGTTNTVYRRFAGTGSAWTALGTCPANGTYLDVAAVSAATYEYFARSDVGSDSLIATITTSLLQGAVIHDPLDYSGTIARFPYSAVDEAIGYQETALWFAGRRDPVFEIGEQETRTFTFSATVPWQDGPVAGAAWWRARKRAKRNLFLRTSRGIGQYVVIVGDVALKQVREGLSVGCTLHVAYQPSTLATLAASSYNPLTSDDGGLGDGGLGANGLGA